MIIFFGLNENKRIRLVLILLSLFFVSRTIGQIKSKKIEAGNLNIRMYATDPSINRMFLAKGIDPGFPGGEKSLVKFAKSKLRYPKTAIRDNIEGSVIVKFTINSRGYVTDPKLLRSVRNDLDNQCLDMLRQMPNWIPAKLGDITTAVNCDWKITFKFFR